MGEIVVKDNIRYRAKDATKVDVVTAGTAIHTKVPVKDTEAWAEAEAQKQRDALQAELDQKRADAEAEIAKMRADAEAELAQKRADADQHDAVVGETEPSQTEEEATKVVDPEVTKVREPSTTKSRGSK
jgi:uncharacterized membrane protein YqiK